MSAAPQRLLLSFLTPAFAAAFLLASAPVQAQLTELPPPPVLKLEPAAASAPTEGPHKIISISPAERAAMDRKSAVPAKPDPRDVDPLTPTAADAGTPRPYEPFTRINQYTRSNRVVEVTVTPAGSTHSYVMVNRDGQRNDSPINLSSGLSVPKFLNFDF